MERNNNSDKTTFKVKFLDEYHDIVIDWSDDKYEYKEKQVFEQLESLTGIPIKYETEIALLEARPNLHKNYPNIPGSWFSPYDGGIGRRGLIFYNNTNIFDNERISGYFVKDNIHDVCILEGERFQLSFGVDYESYTLKRIGIIYGLIPETMVQEGACTRMFCQHSHTKSYFNRIKDLVTNEGLNSQISHRIQAILDHEQLNGYNENASAEMEQIYREFNVKQYLTNNCHARQWMWEDEEEGVIRINHQYLRMRG